MIRKLRDVTVDSPALEDKLTQALKQRNWLAHHFFRERAAEFIQASGRNSMIRELEEAQGRLSKYSKLAYILISRLMDSCRLKNGLE
ncbi:MAG: hypothetical protein PHD43_14880, partial [Methylococcales bacterium]|nr:hypothetical protein [Methylococcales bacterium]